MPYVVYEAKCLRAMALLKNDVMATTIFVQTTIQSKTCCSNTILTTCCKSELTTWYETSPIRTRRTTGHGNVFRKGAIVLGTM